MANIAQICENTAMSNITMWKARLGEKTIQLKDGPPLEDGAEYYDSHKHGHVLGCAYCDANVVVRQSPVALAGVGVKPPVTHFATRLGDSHDDCLWELREQTPYNRPVIDPNKGYRIHLNTLGWSDQFNRASRYPRNEKGQFLPLPDDLRDMERLVVNSVSDLTRFLSKGEYNRVNQSRVFFLDQDVPWDEFCIHSAKPERLLALHRRLQANPQETPVVMMEITPTRYHTSKDRIVKSTLVDLHERYSGRKQQISPAAKIANYADSFVTSAFTHSKEKDDTYFVLGRVEYGRVKGHSVIFHQMNISIDDHRQVVKANVHDIARAGFSAQNPPPPERTLFNWSRQP